MLHIHLVYDRASITASRPANPACHVFGIYGFNHETVSIQYARSDGAMTFAEFHHRRRAGPGAGALRHAALVPEHLHRSLRACPRLGRAATEKVLDFAAA